MAVLTSTGVTFGDATSASARSSFFAPSGTVSLFYRATAPTGWTQVITHNDKMLRVVSSTGGGSAGTNAFSSAFASRPVSATVPVTINGLSMGNTTLDVNTIPSHGHPANNGANTGSGGPGVISAVAPGTSTGNQGAGGAHSHPSTYTSASGPWSTSIDMRVQYIDTILCSLNS